jgi:fatty-acyl-CoA synthase
LSEATEAYDFPDFDENAVATTFHTSGTTGAPKGVCFTHRQIVLHTLAALGALASPAHGQCLRRGDVYMPITPMFHVHCWGLPYVATLLGLKQVYPGRYVPGELIALRAREGVTFSHCVPTMLRMLLDATNSDEASLRGWKMVLGGAALTPGLAAEALRAGMDVFAGYGMSETGPILTLSRLDRDSGDLTSQEELEQRCGAGLPIPLVDLKVIDPTRRDPAPSSRGAGEIVARAPWTTLCYLGRPKASEELWREGYLHTNDVGAIGERGDVRITDRLKDLIKTGGEWVSSLRLEEIIASHPEVAEVAVIAVPHARWGERPHALVVPRPTQGAALRPQDILEHVGQHVQQGAIPRYAMPDRVVIVERLEKTTVGKVDKRALRERYGRP